MIGTKELNATGLRHVTGGFSEKRIYEIRFIKDGIIYVAGPFASEREADYRAVELSNLDPLTEYNVYIHS